LQVLLNSGIRLARCSGSNARCSGSNKLTKELEWKRLDGVVFPSILVYSRPVQISHRN